MVSRTRLATTSLCEPHGALQRPRRDRLRERDLAVDEHHREVDAVAALELVVAVDRDAAQAESEPRRLAPRAARAARAQRPQPAPS